MQKRLPSILAAWLMSALLVIASANTAAAQAKTSEATSSMPKVGEVPPDFKLSYVDGKEEKEVSLSQYRGKKNVVLAFYIFAFTGG